MDYKKGKTTIVLIAIVNLLYLLLYDSIGSNDISAALLTFINPFVSSIVLYWKVNKNASFVFKKFCYYELGFYFSYFLLLILLSNLKVIDAGYYFLTVCFILIGLSLFSLFFFIVDFLKRIN